MYQHVCTSVDLPVCCCGEMTAYYNGCYCSLQVDVCAEEMSNNVAAHVMLVGDIKSVAEQVRIIFNIN